MHTEPILSIKVTEERMKKERKKQSYNLVGPEKIVELGVSVRKNRIIDFDRSHPPPSSVRIIANAISLYRVNRNDIFIHQKQKKEYIRVFVDVENKITKGLIRIFPNLVIEVIYKKPKLHH